VALQKGRAYTDTVTRPFRRYVERYTLLQAARKVSGGLTGKRVLDVACGDGVYTRMLAAEGVSHVTGVDLSPAMVELAKAAQAEAGTGTGTAAPIHYAVADASSLAAMDAVLPGERGSYDLVFAAHLLHYAPDAGTLDAMVATLAAFLKPGGHLLVMNVKPAGPIVPEVRAVPGNSTSSLDATSSVRQTSQADVSIVCHLLQFVSRKHHYLSTRDPDGRATRIHFLDDAGNVTLSLKNYIYSWSDYLGAFDRAGLVDVHAHPPLVDPLAPLPADYFDDLLGVWQYALLSATKKADAPAAAGCSSRADRS